MTKKAGSIFLFFIFAFSLGTTPALASDCVVLLHGMGRTKLSMWKADSYLKQHGYSTVNVDYPSTKEAIEKLARKYIPPAIAQCKRLKTEKIHFLTHSLGGIIIRQFLQDNELPLGSRVVMLSPPSKGSELADTLKEFFLYELMTGPAGQQLGTSKNDLPNKLRPVNVQVGIITGNQTIEPWFSGLISGEDDGKVSVERAKLKEAVDFIVVAQNHTFIMMSKKVIEQADYFFQNGKFYRLNTEP